MNVYDNNEEKKNEERLKYVLSLIPIREKVFPKIWEEILGVKFSSLNDIVLETFENVPEHIADNSKQETTMRILKLFGVIQTKKILSMNGIQLENFLFSKELDNISNNIQNIYKLVSKKKVIIDKIIDQIPNTTFFCSGVKFQVNPYKNHSDHGQLPINLFLKIQITYSIFNYRDTPEQKNIKRKIWGLPLPPCRWRKKQRPQSQKTIRINNQRKKFQLLFIINQIKKIFKECNMEANFYRIVFKDGEIQIPENFFYDEYCTQNPIYTKNYKGENSYTPVLYEIDIIIDDGTEPEFGAEWKIDWRPKDVRYLAQIIGAIPYTKKSNICNCNYCLMCGNIINCGDRRSFPRIKCIHPECLCSGVDKSYFNSENSYSNFYWNCCTPDKRRTPSKCYYYGSNNEYDSDCFCDEISSDSEYDDSDLDWL